MAAARGPASWRAPAALTSGSGGGSGGVVAVDGGVNDLWLDADIAPALPAQILKRSSNTAWELGHAGAM